MTLSVTPFKQGNSDWGNLLLGYDGKNYQLPYYIPTREVFNYDPKSLIRCKCLVLVGLTPVISTIRSIYWLASSIFMVLSEIYRYLDNQNSSPEVQVAIYEKAYDSVRALGYGALMTGSALMGIFSPYEGRWHYGHFERELNRHVDGPHRDKFYLAICFQRLCVLSTDGNAKRAADKLSNYIEYIEAIQAAICACSIQQLMIAMTSHKKIWVP